MQHNQDTQDEYCPLPLSVLVYEDKCCCYNPTQPRKRGNTFNHSGHGLGLQNLFPRVKTKI